MTAETHTRRTVLTTGAAATVGAAALTACGAGGSSQPAAGPPAPPAAPGKPLAALADVPVGQAKAVTTPDGKDAIVSRPTESTVACFSAVCTHQGCKVAPSGSELKCPCHGSVFDARTGDVKQGPAKEPLPKLPVKIENTQIVTA
ncbi:Rieske (2Fe-2S) protein [Amycolatopsis sp. CA-230715]|uniref:Rieske (2Fe-2S) protein n=1 Tax=Amycolatopsis sp. CA-230715 TaxID=2745196 RepID=UPI001C0098BE|nr:Rieske (2Fe-2S) protein [Amycolatopsis sp. CA-230715]QWF84313.1 Cytochrome b6-f complex iron-sulfur subunit [Amycolatopsis sp. CA-230715]